MPVTPLHIPVAYLVHKLGGRLSLPGLVVGSVVPDLEIPVFFMLDQDPNRVVLHSLLGASVFGTLIALVATVFIYPVFVGSLLRLDSSEVKRNCRLSVGLAVSCLIGVLSHVLLDVTNHAFNPVYWPFISMTPSPVTPYFGGAFLASVFVHSLMIVFFVMFYLVNRGRFWNRLLVG